MTTYRLGQRVRTLVNAPAGWPGAFAAPVGTGGTIVGLPDAGTRAYGVLLDGDPGYRAADYQPGEIAPA